MLWFCYVPTADASVVGILLDIHALNMPWHNVWQYIHRGTRKEYNSVSYLAYVAFGNIVLFGEFRRLERLNVQDEQDRKCQ